MLPDTLQVQSAVSCNT